MWKVDQPFPSPEIPCDAKKPECPMMMPHCVTATLKAIDRTNPKFQALGPKWTEKAQEGMTMSKCMCNQKRDYANRTNNKQNSWGMTVQYNFLNTNVKKWCFCDPLKPQNCPDVHPICVKYTVTDADFSNKMYQNYALLFMGMLHPGMTSYMCVDNAHFKEAMMWQSSPQKQEEMYGMMGWKFEAKRIRPRGGKRWGDDDEDSDDDDMKGMMKKGMKKMKAMEKMWKMKQGMNKKKKDDGRQLIIFGNAVSLAATAATAFSMMNFL